MLTRVVRKTLFFLIFVQQGCSAVLFRDGNNAVAPSTSVTPAPDDRELPPVDVAGVHLTGDVVYADGTPVASVRVDLIDEAAGRIAHSSQAAQSAEFALPISKIQTPTLTIRVKAGDRFIFADAVMPADVSTAVNAERLSGGAEGLKDFSANGNPAFKLAERKLVLVLPANGFQHAETNEAVLIGSKISITAISIPNKAESGGKQFGALTSIENLSTGGFVKFAWRKSFGAASSLKIVFAQNEAELSRWNGSIDTVPTWPNQLPAQQVIADFSRCTDPAEQGRPLIGPLSAATDSTCGILRSEFPFSDGGNVFARLVAESETEVRLSEVFFFAANNAPPTISIVDSPPVKNLANSASTFSITINDSDSPLSCSKSLSARSQNTVFLPDENISFTGQSPNCEMRVFALQNTESSSEVVIRVVDDKGSSAQTSVAVARGWQRTSLDTSMLGLDNGDSFGSAVALSANILAVAATEDDFDYNGIITPIDSTSSNNSVINSGAVYVYRRQAGTWVLDAFIKADNNRTDLLFGQSLSISGDTLVVGTTEDKTDASTLTSSNKIVSGEGTISSTVRPASSGAVYVYRRAPDGVWSRQAFIKAFNANDNDNFGENVSISGDLLAVGASKEDSGLINIISPDLVASTDNSALDSGAVYVYKRTNDTWAPEAFVKGFRAETADTFGTGVSLHGDTLAVGAPGDDYGKETMTSTGVIISGNQTFDEGLTPLHNRGSVYIFRRDAIGNWNREAYIKGRNTKDQFYFGTEISVSENTLAVGVPRDNYIGSTIVNNGDAFPNTTGGEFLGSVYIFNRDTTGWKHEAYIRPTNSEAFAFFGSSVSIFGNQLAVGAYGEGSHLDSQDSVFSERPAPDLDPTTQQSNTGAVYLFQRVDSKWFQVNYFKADSPAANDHFGKSVTLWKDTIAVGAPGKNASKGAVYLFQRTQP